LASKCCGWRGTISVDGLSPSDGLESVASRGSGTVWSVSSVVICRRSLRSSSPIESDVFASDLTLWRKAIPPPIAPTAATIRPPKAIKLVGAVIGKITGLEVVAVGVVIVAWTLETTLIVLTLMELSAIGYCIESAIMTETRSNDTSSNAIVGIGCKKICVIGNFGQEALVDSEIPAGTVTAN
jgi:hypothetical protein